MGETIKCAAIKRTDGIILAGRNHSFIIQHSPKGTCGKESMQGFLTSSGRFVGRVEAGCIAFDAKQIKKPIDVLFSEDITQDNPWAGEQIKTLQQQLTTANKRRKELKKALTSVLKDIKNHSGSLFNTLSSKTMTAVEQALKEASNNE